MKKTIVATTAVILILFIIILACLTSYTQSTHAVHKTLEISGDNQQAMSVETTENGEKNPRVEERTLHTTKTIASTMHKKRRYSNEIQPSSESSANINQDGNA